MEKVSAKSIRASLLKQLRAKGADLDHFEALVEDYVHYFELAQRMQRDIEERGMTYITTSSVGKEYEKDNPNVKLLPQYTKTMLSILKDLGLTTAKIESEEVEEL